MIYLDFLISIAVILNNEGNSNFTKYAMPMYRNVMVIPITYTPNVKVLRYEGNTTHEGKLEKITTIGSVGHNINSTFTLKITSIIYNTATLKKQQQSSL